MWLHCPVGAQTTEVLGDKLAISSRCDFQNHLYTWDEAYQKAMNFSFSEYNDWRLPTIEELQNLHDLNTGDANNGLAYINRDAFPLLNCNDDSFSCVYWSSSSNNAINYAEPDKNKAWITVPSNSMHLVRLVRTIAQ